MTTQNTLSNTNTIVTIRKTDESGHSTMEFALADALINILEAHFAEAKQPYVGPTPFQFTATSLQDAEGLLRDTIALRKLLETKQVDGKVTVTLVGELKGGR